MTIAWRIVRAARVATAFSGIGSFENGGRWNSVGTAVVYLSESLALAALELFVHLTQHQRTIRFVAFKVQIPARIQIDVLDTTKLPRNWRAEPAPRSVRQLGDAWARAHRSLAMRVPSVIVPQETNLVVNPRHPDFRRLRIGKAQQFGFDPRMWK